MRNLVVLAAVFWCSARAQDPCARAVTYSPCEIVVEMTEAEARTHPNPYATVETQAEFRSPKYRTFLMPGFWDGGRRIVFRFSPDEAGKWAFRLKGNIAAAGDVTGEFAVSESNAPGFIKPANVHHWMHTEGLKPHLWMGDTFDGLATADRTVFDGILEERARQKFTHIRGPVLGAEDRAFPAADRPDPAYFQELDRRLAAVHARGIVTDLVLMNGRESVARLMPAWQQRARYLRFLVARYSAFNVTWDLSREFESHENARTLMKEMGTALQKLDPYGHPRTAHAAATSGPLAGDGWLNFITYGSADAALGAVEHQMFAMPQVNAGLAGGLWNATMSGQLPVSTGGAGAKMMTAWFEFFTRTRYWDLEPYFDLDGGRALALPGVEYIVYVEKGATVELRVEKHGYDVYWIDPATGASTKEKKEFKGEVFQSAPPTATQDWVLHLSRDSRKEGMLKSYRFEARANLMQEPEVNPAKIPFDVALTPPGALPAGAPVQYKITLKRESGGTRRMTYLLTGEVVRDAQGYRLLASGNDGTFTIPRAIALSLPASLSLRVAALNAAGKLYVLDRILPVQ